MCLRSCFNTYNHAREPSDVEALKMISHFTPAFRPHTEKEGNLAAGLGSTRTWCLGFLQGQAIGRQGNTTAVVSGVQKGVCKHLRTVLRAGWRSRRLTLQPMLASTSAWNALEWISVIGRSEGTAWDFFTLTSA